jgi:hypothetical protein
MNIKKIAIFITLILPIVAANKYLQANNNAATVKSTVNQKDSLIRDVVPNEATAIKIAEAIWLPIYGKKIYEDLPFKAELRDSSVWIVQGTLPKGMKGGTAYIEIQKRDCKILKVTHYK